MSTASVGRIKGEIWLDDRGWVGSIRNIQQDLRALGRSMLIMGTAVTGAVAAATKQFASFDKALRESLAVSEQTSAQFVEMGRMAEDAAVKFNKYATETARGFYFLGSAGLSATEQMQAFNTTVGLARALTVDTAMAAEGLVDIIKAYNMEFSESNRIGDILVKTITSSNQVFSDLEKALSYVASTANLMNNSLAETNAALGVMANAGIKGSMAGVAMRRAITNLMSPTGEMADLVYDLGIEVFDFEGKARPFIDVFGDISDAVQDTTEAYRNMAFETLFGRRAIAGMITVFEYGKDALRAYANELENSEGILERVTRKQMAAFWHKMGQMWQQTLQLTRAIGKSLVPTLKLLALWISGHVKHLTEWVRINWQLVTQIVKLTIAFGVFAMAGGTVLLFLPTLIKSVGLLATAFSAILLPIAVVIAAFYAMRAVWDVTLEDIARQWQNLTDFLALDMKSTLKAMNSDLDAWLIRSLGVVGKLAIGMKWALGESAKSAAAVISFYVHLAKGEVEDALKVWDVPWDENFGALFEGATSAIKETTKYVSELGSEMWTIASSDWSKGITAFVEQVKKAAPELSKLFSILWGKQADVSSYGVTPPKPRNIAEEWGMGVSDSGKKYSSQFANDWIFSIKQVMDNFASMRDGIKGMFTDMKDGWSNAFTDVLQMSGSFKDKMLTLFDDMFDAVYQSLVKFAADMAANSMMAAVFGEGFKSKTNINPQTIGQFMESIKRNATQYPPALTHSRQQYPYSGQLGGAQKISIQNTNTGPDIAFKGAAVTQDGKALIIQTITEEAGNSPAFKQLFRE